MSAGFTPGPWAALNEEDGSNYTRIRGTRLGERFKIANALFAASYPSEIAEARANANLIAAAPDLFEAARLFVEVYDAADGENGVAMMLAYNAALETAKAALSKARGSSPISSATDLGADPALAVPAKPVSRLGATRCDPGESK